MQVPCRNCGGKGSSLRPEDRCQQCHGEQLVKEKKIFEVHIERGAKRGDHVTFSGEGDQRPGIRLSGDIIIIFDQKQHPVFTRKGNHLVMERTISLAEALTGFHCIVEHLDGRKLSISPAPGSVLDPSRLYEVPREGMPVPKTGGVERGNLFIKFNVEYPQHVGEKDLEVLRKILGNPARQSIPHDAEECTLQVAHVKPQDERQADDDDDEQPRGGARTATCAQQ